MLSDDERRTLEVVNEVHRQVVAQRADPGLLYCRVLELLRTDNIDELGGILEREVLDGIVLMLAAGKQPLDVALWEPVRKARWKSDAALFRARYQKPSG